MHKRITLVFFFLVLFFLTQCAGKDKYEQIPQETIASEVKDNEAIDKIATTCSETDQFTFKDIGLAIDYEIAGLADDVSIADSTAVVLPDGKVRMYFQYRSTDGSSAGHKSAISSDGITFTVEPGDRILMDEYWGPHIKAMVLSDTELRIYKGATPGSNSKTGIISYITTDGLTLTKEEGFRITPTAAGLSRLSHLTIAAMADGTYRGYFSNMPQITKTALLIKSATSTDLLSWTVDDDVRIGKGSTTLSTYSAEQPHALQRGKGCVTLFYYSTYDNSASEILIPTQLRYSTSKDGITFNKDYTLYSGSGNMPLSGNGPDIIRLKDGTYLLYYDVGGGPDNPGKIRVGKLELK